MIAFAVSDRLARDAGLDERRLLAQSLLDDINAEAFRQGVPGAALDRVVLTDRKDGSQIVTVEGVAGKKPATMADFTEARRRGFQKGRAQ